MKSRALFLCTAFALLSATACKSEIDGKSKAKVEDRKATPAKKPEAEAKKPAAAGAAHGLTLNAEKSSLKFVGAKVTGDHSGEFHKISGAGKLNGKNLESLQVKVDTTNLSTDAQKLTAHLKSPDFFDVAKFPTSEFKSTSITAKAGPKGETHEVAGNLTLRGVTKGITFPATIHVSGQSVHSKAEFTINRKDFGILYKGKADDLIKDEVLLKLELFFGAGAH